jgi:hypothetical protein
MPARRIYVLGTDHRLQGSPGYGRRNVDDPGYLETVNRIISSEGIDFLFEEAAGGGQTLVGQLAGSLQSVGYLDVDPHPKVAHLFGIVNAAGQPFPEDISAEECVEKEVRREELWCQTIVVSHFKSGLLICGYYHTLSMVFRLRSTGLLGKCGTYLPHEKLCSRRHPT